MIDIKTTPDCEVCERAAARTQAAADQVGRIMQDVEPEQAAFIALCYARIAMAHSPYRTLELSEITKGATVPNLLDALVTLVSADLLEQAHKRAGDGEKH